MDAAALHGSLLVVDGHCDSALDAAGISATNPAMGIRDLGLRSTEGHIDLPRMLEAGISAQFFALFTGDAYVAKAREHTWMLLETMEAFLAGNPGIDLGLHADDIIRAKAEGRVAAFLAIEGGEAIGESLDELRAFYNRGVRLMTLTWNRRNAIARGVGAPGTGGLSGFGRKVVAEMERLGMIVDVSHLSDEALDDVLAVATRPLVASHSNAKAVQHHRRNLTDEQLRRIAATDGLVGLTFAGVFIDADPAKVTLERALDHLDRLVSVVGEDHVGLGTDFDGFTASYGTVMPDCTTMSRLTAGMLRRGYPEETIRKVMGLNWLRVASEILG
ncbi:MAG: dipeptidase [Spirochaetota bacterium]